MNFKNKLTCVLNYCSKTDIHVSQITAGFEMLKYQKIINLKDNPYPYLKNAFAYIHTSHFEGKSRAIEEAKIFNKSIVTTNFPSVKNQIIDNQTGIIVDFNANELATAILNLLENENLKYHFENNLTVQNATVSNNLNYFYQLIK